VFSVADLKASLRFGLPRVPHGLALHVLDGGNKLLLGGYITQAALGVFQVGMTLGSGIKFFTSAFETAWAPFYYATARLADGKDTLRRIVTYGIAVLVLLAAGTTAIARDVIFVMLTPDYLPAAPLLPIIATGMACQGIYYLTSIGLNLTNRTEFYPVATFAAAGVVLGAGVWLMPRYGALGAAVAFLLASATQTGVASLFAQRFYRIDYEYGRIARIVVAGAVAAFVALWVIPPLPPVAGLIARGTATVGVYLGLLWLTGFLRASERAFLREIVQRRSRVSSSK